MSQLPAQYVKRGMWINEEEGHIFGRVITADSQTGGLVVAILAVVTAFGSTHLWNLVTFFYHQMRVNNARPLDGLYRQQQALLRTLPTPSALVSDWIRLWWAWRHRTQAPFLRSLPQILLGSLFAIATIAVSLASSYIVDTTNILVLVESPLCGPTQVLLERFWAADEPAVSEYFQSLQTLAPSYADNCYKDFNGTTVPERCGSFTRPNIPFKKERVQCPFEQSLCANIDLPAMHFDSGLVDLNDAFGLNLLRRDRLKYRRKTTCAIINMDGRISTAEDQSQLKYLNDTRMEVSLGKTMGNLGDGTYYYSSVEANTSTSIETIPYMKYGAPEYADWNTLEPLGGMANDDADITLIVVQPNAMIYQTAVDDPFFSAHKTIELESYTDGQNATWYVADSPVSAFGCEVQHQYCYNLASGEEHCTALAPLPPPASLDIFPGASETQLSALQLVIDATGFYDLESGSSRLKAALLGGSWGEIKMIPEDQWIQELTSWEAAIWANAQIWLSEYAIGIGARVPNAAEYQKAPETEGEKQLCHTQKMRSPGGFANISVFGLVFTVTFSCVAVFLDVILLKFLIFLKQFRSALAPRIDAWIQDGTFQLQRRAYEAYGEGQWERFDEEIPLHKHGEELAPLPLDSQPLDFPFGSSCCRCDCQDIDEKPPLKTAASFMTDQVTIVDSLVTKSSPSSSTEGFPPELKRPPTYNTSNAQWRADQKSASHSSRQVWKR